MRLAPSQDAAAALAALQQHLVDHAPDGARVTFGASEAADGSLVTLSGEVADAARAAYSESFGVEVVEVGQGGSIPLVGAFQKAFPGAAVLVTGVVDPDSRMHGIDESFDLADFTSACIAEASFLAALAAK